MMHTDIHMFECQADYTLQVNTYFALTSLKIKKTMITTTISILSPFFAVIISYKKLYYFPRDKVCDAMVIV